MKTKSISIIAILLSFSFSSCFNKSEELKDKEIQLLKKELELKNKEDSIINSITFNQKSVDENKESKPLLESNNELSFLRKLGGKYASEEKLFEKGTFNNRLKQLLKNDYTLFKDNCLTQGQIEILNNSKFYLSCAQPHNFGSEESFIFADIDLNLITVAILTDDKVKIFTENQTKDKLNDAKLYTWLNDKIDPFEGIEFSKTKDKYHEFQKKI